jgi:pimeloyl-ACP methyl ester carboxylesterase
MRGLRRVVAPFVVACLAWQMAPAAAYHDAHQSHACPIKPPKVQYHFASGFRPPVDSETVTEEFQKSTADGGCGGSPWRVAGFGGANFKPVPDRPRVTGTGCRGKGRAPVIFVHGNNVDAGDWYPALLAFKDQGFTMCELWGLGYNGVGGNNGNALHTQNPRAVEERGADGDTTRVTGNMINVPDVESFIRKVLAFTGARRFNLVSHSLGVTIVRRVLKDNPDLLHRLKNFVGIAGANRGTTFCRGNEAFLVTDPETALISCDEIAPDVPGVYTNPWLAELNSGDETPGRGRYLTVYDGSGSADPAFVGPDAPSPRLEGAINCAFSGAYHNDLRIDPLIAAFYARFVAGQQMQQVAAGATPAAPNGSSCDSP